MLVATLIGVVCKAHAAGLASARHRGRFVAFFWNGTQRLVLCLRSPCCDRHRRGGRLLGAHRLVPRRLDLGPVVCLSAAAPRASASTLSLFLLAPLDELVRGACVVVETGTSLAPSLRRGLAEQATVSIRRALARDASLPALRGRRSDTVVACEAADSERAAARRDRHRLLGCAGVEDVALCC